MWFEMCLKNAAMHLWCLSEGHMEFMRLPLMKTRWTLTLETFVSAH